MATSDRPFQPFRNLIQNILAYDEKEYDQQNRPGQPQRKIAGVQRRAEEDELAKAVDDIVKRFFIRVASHQTLPHQKSKITGERGVAVVNAFIAADQTAQFL